MNVISHQIFVFSSIPVIMMIANKKRGDCSLNERGFTPDFCFSSIPVIMLIANKKKGVRKESEKEKTRCICVEKKRIEIEKEK